MGGVLTKSELVRADGLLWLSSISDELFHCVDECGGFGGFGFRMEQWWMIMHRHGSLSAMKDKVC